MNATVPGSEHFHTFLLNLVLSEWFLPIRLHRIVMTLFVLLIPAAKEVAQYGDLLFLLKRKKTG